MSFALFSGLSVTLLTFCWDSVTLLVFGVGVLPRVNITISDTELENLEHISDLTGYSVSTVAAVFVGEACLDLDGSIGAVFRCLESDQESQMKLLDSPQGRSRKRRRL